MSLFINDFTNHWTSLVTCHWSWWQCVWFDVSPCFTDSMKSFWCSRRCHSDSKLLTLPHPLWLQPSHIIMTLCFTLDSLTYCTLTHLSILKPAWSQLSYSSIYRTSFHLSALTDFISLLFFFCLLRWPFSFFHFHSLIFLLLHSERFRCPFG